MILPDKNIVLQYSILGSGGGVLQQLSKPLTVSTLWEKVKPRPEIQSFEKFIWTLDFLFALNLIELNNGLLSLKSQL